jgi:hypothetical protein
MSLSDNKELLKRIRQENIILRQKVAHLENSRLRIAKIVSRGEHHDTMLEIIDIHNTIDGIFIRVAGANS